MTGASLFDCFESLSLGWCDWMLQISWQVALLVFILTVVTRLLRQRSAVLLHALWLLVLLRLVLPPDFSIPTGWGWWVLPARPAGSTLEPSRERVIPDVSQRPGVAESEAGPDVAEIHGAEVADSSAVSPSPHEGPPAVDENHDSESRPVERRAEVKNSPAGPRPWAGYLMLAWLGVSSTLLALLAIGTIRIWKWVYDAEPIDDAELYKLLEGCRRQLGMTRLVELRNSDACTTPVVVGFSQPVILLPRAVLQRLTPDELRAVLLHELNHVVRGDAIVNLLQGILGALYFFHPLVWWANARLRELREEACDEMTVAALEGRRKIYGEAIVKVTEIFGYASPPLALGVMESKTPAYRRLSRILDPQLPAGRRLNLQEAGLILLLGIILLPSAGARAPAADGRANAEAAKDPVVVVKTTVAQVVDGAQNAAEKPISTEGNGPPATTTREADEGAPQPTARALKYLWQTDRVFSYSVRIEADLGDETETLTGTPSLRVRWADAERAEIVYSGALSSDRRMRPGSPVPFPPRPPRHAFSTFGGAGWNGPFQSEHTLQVDHFGKPLDIRGDSQLPYILGNLSQLLIVPLSNPPAHKWEESAQSVLTLYPPEERFPGPRFGPFARRQAEEKLDARESSHYTLEVGAAGPWIKRQLELKSTEVVEGQPRLMLTGQLRIRFDADRGCATAIDGKLQHLQSSAHSTIRIPIEFTARLLPEQPVAQVPPAATNRGTGFSLPGSPSEYSSGRPESPALPVEAEKQPLGSAAVEGILKSLGGVDAGKIRSAVELLNRSLPGERQREIARALGGCLSHQEEAVRASVAQALADWATIAESPVLIAALDDESPSVVRGAIDGLGRLRDPAAIGPLVQQIRSRKTRASAAESLRKIGRPAEPAVAELLKDADWSIRLDACRILQTIGTAQSLPDVEHLADADPNILVRRGAAEALEEIKSATETSSK